MELHFQLFWVFQLSQPLHFTKVKALLGHLQMDELPQQWPLDELPQQYSSIWNDSQQLSIVCFIPRCITIIGLSCSNTCTPEFYHIWNSKVSTNTWPCHKHLLHINQFTAKSHVDAWSIFIRTEFSLVMMMMISGTVVSFFVVGWCFVLLL